VTGDVDIRQSLRDILGSDGYRLEPVYTRAEVLADNNWMLYKAIVLDYLLLDGTADRPDVGRQPAMNRGYRS
jgi:hypothetical protein